MDFPVIRTPVGAPIEHFFLLVPHDVLDECHGLNGQLQVVFLSSSLVGRAQATDHEAVPRGPDLIVQVRPRPRLPPLVRVYFLTLVRGVLATVPRS